MSQELTGKIKRIKADKGFGFILGEDGTEYFFHKSVVARSPTSSFDTLRENQSVSFIPEKGPKGTRAARVTPT